MKRAEAVRILAEARAVWEPFGVEHLMIFGSVARDEAKEGSDIDLLVEFSRPVGLLEKFRLQRQLEHLLGTKVDLGSPEGLRPSFRDKILAEAVHVA